jgi:hypothetical protein
MLHMHHHYSVDVAQIVLEYFKVLAWPLIVVAVLLRFTPSLRDLLARLSQISSPDGYIARFDREAQETATFADEALRDAEAARDVEDQAGDGQVAQPKPTMAEELGLSEDDVIGWAQAATRMARLRPVAMMLEAWSKLEELVGRSARSWKLEALPRTTSFGDFAGLLAQLQARGLPANFFRVGIELAVLRERLDKIIEAGNKPSSSSAQDFIAACEQLMKGLLALPSEPQSNAADGWTSAGE